MKPISEDDYQSKKEGVVMREGQIRKNFFYHSVLIQHSYHINESLIKKIDRNAPDRDYQGFVDVITKAVNETGKFLNCTYKPHSIETHLVNAKEYWPNAKSYFPATFTALYCVDVDKKKRVVFEDSVLGHPENGKLFVLPSMVSFKPSPSEYMVQKYISITYDVDR